MRLRLVDNWREWWRWGSMRLNVVATLITGFFMAQPQFFVGIFGGLPEEKRIPFAIASALLIGGAVFISRITKIEKGGKDACERADE